MERGEQEAGQEAWQEAGQEAGQEEPGREVGGWQEHRGLPAGWRVRAGRAGSAEFLTRCGVQLGSAALALDWLAAQPGYSEQDRLKIQFISSLVSREARRVELGAHQETLQEEERGRGQEDPTLPSGWVTRYTAGGVRCYSSGPGGPLYRSRRSAYQQLVTAGTASPAILASLRESLQYEGWQHSDTLPAGWLENRTSEKGRLHLMGAGGELFISSAAAARFVHKYAEYFSTEEQQNIFKLATKCSGGSLVNIINYSGKSKNRTSRTKLNEN